ncbi:MAG: oligopeptide ABC transporter ATP-binding protein OppD, partial [Sinobacteraceae bacterium]|nr:oligopeptide ABC transporter ATP-binding protein OppD [Nevskiaceae bacterium]
TFSTPAGEVQAVRNVSLEVARGECLGVVGESGAGKSQTFLAALGLLAANGRASGRARFGSADLLSLKEAQLDAIRGARIGVVFQDPMNSLTPQIRIGEQIAEPIRRHRGCSSREAAARALDLLNQVHVTDAASRMRQYPHELSGGMRQRVMIAIAIACDPVLLIADEPTTALDVTIQAQILSLLSELKRSRGMSMVLITHDMAVVAGVADRVAVMRRGEVVEVDTVRAVFKAPRHVYTRALLGAVPALAGAPPQVPQGTGAPALVLDDLHVRFSIRRGWFARRAMLHAVDGVSLQVGTGEALGVVGESGSGKTTLARAALRLIRAESGRVVWLGRPVDGLSQRELRPLRRKAQIIFQDPLASLDPRMTVAEIIAEPLQVHQPELSTAARRAAVSEALARVHLDPVLVTRYPHELSGGQCQRVGIARAMVLQPHVLVCDEPVTALDATVQQQIVGLLCELKREAGLAILFISHNLAVVRQLCERVLVLYLGRMMELAPAAAIYSQPRHPYTAELLASAPIPDPDTQPSRLARAFSGEPPSVLSAPGGCVYRTRCPHAITVCRERVPQWEVADGTGWGVACHRWRDLRYP